MWTGWDIWTLLRGKGELFLCYTHSSQIASSPTVENHRKLSPNDLLPNPQPTNQRIGLGENKKEWWPVAMREGASVSVYFLKPINDKAAWRERKTQHGCEKLFFQINGQISNSVISTSTYQNTHTHIQTHMHTHTLTLGWSREIRILKIQDNIQEALWIL